MMMEVNGKILLTAATCPPAAVTEGIVKTLLRVRQAEFEFQAGVTDPDAWDIGAGEPNAPTDISRTLEEHEFGRDYRRWREQWESRITLAPHQQELQEQLSGSKFRKRMEAV